MIVTLKGKEVKEVESLEQAVRVCAEFRDTNEMGATIYYGYKTGRVLDTNNKQIARIHYNGRIEAL